MNQAAGRRADLPPASPDDIVGEEVVEPAIDDGVTTATPISEQYDPAERPRDSPYNPAKDREDMRKWLGMGILGTTGLVALLAAAAILAGSTDSETLLTGVFTPLVGLSGAVIGFYFGGKDAKA